MTLGIGQYPPEYNPKVHGPYNPGQYYGKPDLKLSEVKVGQLGSWLGRRSFNPQNMVRAMSRGYWQWNTKWLMPKRAGIAPLGQFMLGLSLFYYVQQYSGLKYHRHVKYHW